MSRSIRCRWDGERFTPEPQDARRARGFFIAGNAYVLDADDPISHKERSFYHAQIKDAWDNLNDITKASLGSADNLRKWALIKSGWRVENQVFGPDRAWAIWTEHFHKKRSGEYTTVITTAPENESDLWSVKILQARTQKVGNPEEGYMTREEWKQSKDDVLFVVSQMIGVSKGTLAKQGRGR